MPDQSQANLQDAVTKALLASTLYSVLLSPICVQPASASVPQPHLSKKVECILSIPSLENPCFAQESAISILQCEGVQAEGEGTVVERFHQLAAEWSKEVQNVSSLTAMSAHPKYRKIVDLGWDAVPAMLLDLEENHGFWFPALKEITGIQPFDRSDAGNGKRMIEAWVRWGKRRKLI